MLLIFKVACFCVNSAGMAIQTIVFFICFLFLVFLIIIPVFYGRNIIVFEIAGKAWWVSNDSYSSFLFSLFMNQWFKTPSFSTFVMSQAGLGHTDTGYRASACDC